MDTTTRRIYRQLDARYEASSFRSPDRLRIRWPGDAYDGPSYRSATRRIHTTARRLHSQTADRYDGLPGLTTARRTAVQPVVPIRRPVVTIAGPSLDTTGRRIHIQGVVSIGRTCGKKSAGQKGGAPEGALRATLLRRGHFSAVADGSAGAAGLTIEDSMILLEVKRGTAGLMTSLIQAVVERFGVTRLTLRVSRNTWT